LVKLILLHTADHQNVAVVIITIITVSQKNTNKTNNKLLIYIGETT